MQQNVIQDRHTVVNYRQIQRTKEEVGRGSCDISLEEALWSVLIGWVVVWKEKNLPAGVSFHQGHLGGSVG